MTALGAAALICDLIIVGGGNAQVRGETGDGLGWQTFQMKDFGTTVDYPATIFSEPAGKSEKGTGQRFNSADGRSTLTIYALENAEGDTPASYLRKNLRMPRSALDYERVTRSLFRDLDGGPGHRALQPLQLRGQRRHGPLHRPRLSAVRGEGLGRHGDPHQPLAAPA